MRAGGAPALNLTTPEALILFGHGARDPEWAQPMQHVQALLEQAHPQVRVASAFLEFMAPDLPTCVAQLVGDGVRCIQIVPMFLARGGHLKRALPAQVAVLQARYPGCELSLAAPVGEDDRVLQAMAEYAWRLTHAARGGHGV